MAESLCHKETRGMGKKKKNFFFFFQCVSTVGKTKERKMRKKRKISWPCPMKR